MQILYYLVQGDFMYQYKVETFQNILYRQNVLHFLFKKGNKRLLFMFSEGWNIFKDPINSKLIIVAQVICKLFNTCKNRTLLFKANL